MVYYWLLYVNVLLIGLCKGYIIHGSLSMSCVSSVNGTNCTTSCFERLTPNNGDKKLFDT